MTTRDDTPLDGTSDEDILADAQMRFKRCQDREINARKNMRADLAFAEGDMRNGAQWDETDLSNRKAELRPALTNNLVRQHCIQIVNDARQNKPGIEVRATGDGSTYEAAKVYEGLCRHIEYDSNAQAAYDTATYYQVYGGRGWCRVLTEYADDASFDQDIKIKRVPDPFSIYLDPDVQQYDGSDAKFGFVFSDTDRREFEKKHPDLDLGSHSSTLDADSGWVTDDHVREAEYYRKVEKPDHLTEMQDGRVVRDSDMQPGHAAMAKAMGLRRRKATRTEIEVYKIAGREIIGKTIWKGAFIPLVHFVGEVTVIDGKLDIKGHTRAMISAQQMHNYFYSAAVEHVALQGKTPWIGQAEAFEGFEQFYENANKVNYAWLPYKGRDEFGQPIPRPERAQPPVMAQAFIQGLTISSTLIMDVSGQHQANLGEPSNEKSGVAIQQRQRQGDNATAHYIDHQAQAIRFLGRILVDLIPKIYDTKRVVQILNQDGSRLHVQIDPQAADAHQQVQNPEAQDYDEAAIAAIFNPNVGKYAVVADIGPSFATKRQDAFNAFSQIMQNNQEAMKIGGDLMWKNADFPGADDLAARWRRTVPPNLLTDDGPPPEVQQMQQQLQLVQQHGAALASQADQEIQALKAQLATATQKLEIEEYKAQTARMQAVGSIDPAALIPLIREQVSQLLGAPALPIIQAHQAEDALHAQALAAGPPGAMGGPMGAPDPVQPPAGGATSDPEQQPGAA